MVVVAVGDEDVRHGEVVLLHGVEQRLERRARVDEDRCPARLVVGEVRLREPARMHAADDFHAASLTMDGAPSGARDHSDR